MSATYRIRPARMKDAADINEIRRMPGVIENICALKSEPVSMAVEMLEDPDPSEHLLVAEATFADGSAKAVGLVYLAVNGVRRSRHSASIALMVHTAHQGRGIGERLLTAVLDVADNWLKLVRVELDVFTCNERAIRLYEKLGFEKEGVKRKAAIRLGKYADEVVMSRLRNCER